MKNQNSYKNENNKLYIVPTPIGNLKDITIRAIETLQDVDYIFCEDTRNTLKLLNHFDIKKKLIPYHEYSDDYQISKFREIITSHNVAYVSDAGMPGISDPCFDLILICDDLDVDVVVLPGASAFILPLVRSNYSAHSFTFYGFLDSKDSKRKKQINTIISKNEVAIIYESKHRIMKTLMYISEISPEINITIGRELSKIHENYIIGAVSEIIDSIDQVPKGEFVIVIDKFEKKIEKTPEEIYETLIDMGYSKKDAIKETAKKLSASKNEIYQLFIDK